MANLERVNLERGRSIKDSGQRIGTGLGIAITPTVTESELVTKPGVYPGKFTQVTKDGYGPSPGSQPGCMYSLKGPLPGGVGGAFGFPVGVTVVHF